MRTVRVPCRDYVETQNLDVHVHFQRQTLREIIREE